MTSLTGANTFTGRVNLQEGLIQVGDGTGASALAALSANASPISIGLGTELRYNVANSAAVYNPGTMSGSGLLRLAAANTATFVLDEDNGNWIGDTIVDGGTLRFGGSNNANILGNLRGTTTINAGGVLQAAGATSATSGTITPINEWVTFNQGSTLSAVIGGTTNTLVIMSGVMTLNNTSPEGFVVNMGLTQSVTWSGLVVGQNGFTKTGLGTFILSGNNFTEAIQGQTGAGLNPNLFGQIKVNDGDLRAAGVNTSNARAFGAVGVGNETVVTGTGTVDLRGQNLSYGDDSRADREIFRVEGAGYAGTGAMRNTTGTGQFAHLVLTGNATLSSGGSVNTGSRLDLVGFDTNPNNGSGLDGNFTRTNAKLDGGGFTLSIIGAGAVVLNQPDFVSALGKININEGTLRLESAVRVNDTIPAWGGLTGGPSGNVTGGIEIAYTGPSIGNQTSVSFGLGANVGARLNLFRNWDTHHTVNITLNGVTAKGSATTLSGGGFNYIDTGTDTTPSPRVYLDGAITLLGDANRNIFHNESSTSNANIIDQANLTTSLQTKLIVGGIMSGSGGFTKTGTREVRLTNTNTFTGEVNVLRSGSTSVGWQSNTVMVNGVAYNTFGDAEGWAEYGLTLAGSNATLSGTSAINLQRGGMLTLDNTNRLDLSSAVAGGNNDDRINNAASINFDQGWLRIHGGTAPSNEMLATSGGASVNIRSGTNLIDLWPTDGANQAMTLTIGSLSRSPGSVLRIRNLDATSTFGSADPALTPTVDSVRVALTNASGLVSFGSGSQATNLPIYAGIFGGTMPHGYLEDLRELGYNNTASSDLLAQGRNQQQLAGSHFMTRENGYLRPLDDSEYYTPTDGLLRGPAAAGQNVNLTDVFTMVPGTISINALRIGPAADHNLSGTALNNGTTLTSYNQSHANTLIIDGTLTVNSGMISSAYFTVGNTASSTTVIQGGTLNFGTSEGIINNQNGFVRLTDGTVQGGSFEIRSNIAGTGGLTKTGFQQVVLDGQNTYSGLTTISEGTLVLRNGRFSGGAGGPGNGYRIESSGNLITSSGINLGSATGAEDILVGLIQGDQTILNVQNDLTNYYGNIILDNVDAAGQTLFVPRVNVAGNSTLIINGNITGGSSVVNSDVNAIDSRLLTTNGSGNGFILLRGQIGDQLLSGAAAPVANTVSALGTSATLSNENEVLRFQITGSNDLNFTMERQYASAGRLLLDQGVLNIGYNPSALGSDGSGFWTTAALSRIANRDSNNIFDTTNAGHNGNTSAHGFTIGSGGGNTALFLGQSGKDGVSGQFFNMASWRVSGGNTTHVGGINETGSVTFGDGTGSLSLDKAVRFYAMAGGTVNLNMRINNGNSFQKVGRGELVLQNTLLNSGSDTHSFEPGGGTLRVDHTGQNVARMGGSGNVTLRGGRFISTGRTDAAATGNYGTATDAARTIAFTSGGNEIVAQTIAAQNMTLTLGNTNADNGNLTRSSGATANFVENNLAGGVAAINLQFGTTTPVIRNRAIPWATYGTRIRTATDFARVNGNAIDPYLRPVGALQNNVALWGANLDISENGGSGFGGTLASASGGGLAINTLRFDTLTDSAVNLGNQVLSLVGGAVSGAILVSSNTGFANKTIANGSINFFNSSVRSEYNFTLSGKTTDGSRNITEVTSTQPLGIGMLVTGSGIPTGSTISAISGATVTLTNAATATTAVGTFVTLNVNQLIGITDGDNLTAPANLTITEMPTTVGLLPGMLVTGIQSVTAVKVTSPGSGYDTPPSTPISNTNNLGSGASASARLGLSAASFTITSGTTTYSVAPNVAITGGGGSGATAIATLTANLVTGITITNPGTGYTTAPTLTFIGGTVLVAGTAPTAAGNASNFVVSAVVVTASGSGYGSQANIAFNGGGGSGASARVIVPFVAIPAETFITEVTPTSVTLSAKPTISSDPGVKMPFTTNTSELVVHQYGQGKLNIASAVTGPGALTISGPSTTNVNEFNTTGTVRLTGANTYTGRTFLNGSVLEIASANSLGANPSAVTNTQLTMNGGTLRWTGGVGSLGNRGVTLQGSGGVIEVADPQGNLSIGNGVNGSQAQIVSEDAFRGDLIKTGAGTLTLQGSSTGHNGSFQGLLDIRQGSLIVMVDDSSPGTTSILGTNRSWADGTIFRQGTNFQAFLGNGNNGGDWNLDEFMTFEGGNTFTYSGLLDNTNNTFTTDGILNLGNRRPLNLNGVTNIAGTTTLDIGPASIIRIANNQGYLTGAGDIIKDGQGQLEFRGNSPDWKGNLVIKQGTVYAITQADVLGVGHETGKTITLGDSSSQGIAQLLIQNPDNIQNWIFDIKHDINVVKSTQTKRIGIDNVANGNRVSLDGNITLNDNLIVLLQDGAISLNGEQAVLSVNGSLRDGASTSGNIMVQATDAGGANDNLNGRMTGYLALNGNNSAWTGDISVSANTSYDQDKTAVLRLGHNQALTAANDVTMNFNSILQVGGRAATIGALRTLGGNGSFNGDVGTMSAGSNNGTTSSSTEIIENASETAGTLTITETTPATFDVAWDAKFRNGVLNSQFFAPGSNTVFPAASLSLVKAGNGWSVLTLDNDYTGTTTVNGGILQVGRGSVGDTGAINAGGTTVNNGATLAGTGWVQGGLTVKSGALVSPGDSAGAVMGTLNVSGTALFEAGSKTLLQITAATYNNPGALDVNDPGYSTWISSIGTDEFSIGLSTLATTEQHDMINAGSVGTINMAVGSQVELKSNGYSPKAGDVFRLFNAGTMNISVIRGASIRTGNETGTDLKLFDLGANFVWDTSLLNTLGVLLVTTADTITQVVAPIYAVGETGPRRLTPPGVLAAGAECKLEVKVNSPSAVPITIQWLRNGLPVAESSESSTVRVPANGIPAGNNVTSTLTLVASSATKGTYSFVASNAGGELISAPGVSLFVDVNDNILIAQQPVGGTVNPSLPGSPTSYTFNAEAQGPGPTYVFEWFKVVNGFPVSTGVSGNATRTTPSSDRYRAALVLNNIVEADQGDYFCRFTSSVNSSLTNQTSVATLTVRDAVSSVVATRTRNPNSTYQGETITFSVTASGEAPLTYQWFKNNAALTDAASIAAGSQRATFTVASPVIQTVADTYFVRVSNPLNTGANAVQSNTLNLKAENPIPVITSSTVASRTLLAGASLNMSVSATGRPDIRYTWKRNGTTVLSDLLGVFSATPIAITQGGTYVCEASNITTTKALSSMAEIVVVDNSTRMIPVKIGATTFSLTANVGRGTKTSVDYKWYKRTFEEAAEPGDPPVIVDTAVSITDTRITGEEQIGTVSKPSTTTNVLKFVGTATAPITLADDGLYVCKVKGPDGVEVAGCFYDVRVYNAAPVNNTMAVLKRGVVGGFYSDQVVVDPARNLTPVSYSATGLPPGLTIDKTTGVISGVPIAAGPLVSGVPTFKVYTVTTWASNLSVPPDSVPVPSTIRIDPIPQIIPGVYAGPIERHPVLNGNLGGRFDMTVTATG
ncbi:MAG: autotransporter-associated beta strand repeat-containing protein, partial [Verrucomicrobia bacterium]|nr:autotransporter-associated beta strand repeat-containing protein [Verrucomicrobiota bacterium]